MWLHRVTREGFVEEVAGRVRRSQPSGGLREYIGQGKVKCSMNSTGARGLEQEAVCLLLQEGSDPEQDSRKIPGGNFMSQRKLFS